MIIIIRKAALNDLNSIMDIIKETVQEMNSYGNNQWDENYPKSEDFINDIEKGDLFVEEVDNKICGFICINYIEPAEYETLKWSLESKAVIIHRMAVNPSCRNQGVGTKLMNFAEETAVNNEIKYLRTDTNSINIKMNSLFKKCGLKFIGQVNFPGKEKPFYCYDKVFND